MARRGAWNTQRWTGAPSNLDRAGQSATKAELIERMKRAAHRNDDPPVHAMPHADPPNVDPPDADAALSWPPAFLLRPLEISIQ